MQEQHVVFQVQILVKSGVAKFDHPLPNGLTEVLPKHGWVALEPSFCDSTGNPKQHLQHLIGQIVLLFTLFTKDKTLFTKDRPPHKELAEALKMLTKCSGKLRDDKPESDPEDGQDGEDEDGREKPDPGCSLDRAKEALGRHQQHTLGRFAAERESHKTKQPCEAVIRLISFRRDEVLHKISEACGVPITSGQLSDTIPKLTIDR